MARLKKVIKEEIEEAIEEAASLTNTGPSYKERLEGEREDLYELEAKLKVLGVRSISDLENLIAKLNSEISKL